MNKFLVAMLATLCARSSAEVVFGASHGDKMSVEYEKFAPDKNILFVRETIGMEGNRALKRDVHSVDLNFKKNEYLASNYGFKCDGKDKSSVYGVISRLHAKKE